MKHERPVLLKTSSTSEKTCPLRAEPCLGPRCALWVAIQKPITIETGYRHDVFLDPYHILVYRGCGLIQHIPWERTPIKPSKGSEKEGSTNE